MQQVNYGLWCKDFEDLWSSQSLFVTSPAKPHFCWATTHSYQDDLMNILFQKTNVILIKMRWQCSALCRHTACLQLCKSQSGLLNPVPSRWHQAGLIQSSAGKKSFLDKGEKILPLFVDLKQITQLTGKKNHSRSQGLQNQNGLKDISSFDLINSSRQNYDIYSLHSMVSDSHTHTPHKNH